MQSAHAAGLVWDGQRRNRTPWRSIPKIANTGGPCYARWPFWEDLVDNAQCYSGQADLTIGGSTPTWSKTRLADRIFERIKLEHERTVEAICLMTGQAELLDNMPLKRSIERAILHRFRLALFTGAWSCTIGERAF